MTTGSSGHDWRRGWTVFVGSTAVGAAVAVAVLGRVLFPFLSGDHDEGVYLLQAAMLRARRLTLPAAQPVVFRPHLSGVVGTKVLLPFSPVWPAVIAVAHVLTGTDRSAQPIVALAAVLATAALAIEALDDANARVVGVLLFVASPMFWLLAATYLPYVFLATLVAAASAALLRALRTGRRVWFVAAGAFVGLIAVARPFDALITAVVLAVFALTGERRQPAWHGAPWVAVSAAPFVALILVLNRHLTGNAFRFPLTATGGHNAFGFGPRSIDAVGLQFDYTPRAAFFAIKQNLWFFPWWVACGWVAVLLAAVAVWHHRDDVRIRLLVGLTLAWPIAYVFWWATMLTAPNARDGLGPHYYVPALVPFALLAATGLVRVWHLAPRVGRPLLVVVCVAATVVTLPGKIRDKIDGTDRERVAVHAVSGVPAPAIVLLADSVRVGHPHPTLRNDPGLHNPVLYAALVPGVSAASLHRRFPRRGIYVLRLLFGGYQLVTVLATPPAAHH